MNDDERKEVLKTRAQALAKEAVKEDPSTGHLEVLEFLLGPERYGIETRYIREVYPLRDLTPLPCTPSFVAGVVNVRGSILSLIDLKAFFGLPKKELTDLNKVVVIQNRDMEFGLLADEVPGVQRLKTASIQPSLPTLTDIRAEYLKGVTEDRLIILDAEKVLSDKKMLVHEEV